LRRVSRFITSPVAAEPSSTTAKSATTGRSTDGSAARTFNISPSDRASAGSIFSATSASYAKASASASIAFPTGRS
jgi:hypothetical protein